MRVSSGWLALLLISVAAPAFAQKMLAEGKIGRIAPSVATSPCIGAATSAVCMTETLLACFARAEPVLCAQVGVAPHTIGREPGPIEYVIDRVNVIRAEEINDDLRDVDWFKAGYTLVELRRRNCPIEGCASESWEDMQVYLRPRDNAWEIVAWRGSEQEGAPELPDNFNPPARPQ